MRDAVLWVLGQEGTEQGARTSCTGCQLEEIWCGDCPVEREEVPRRAEEAKRYLALYTRCVTFHTLPKAGGVDEQDELEMRMLDIVGGTVAKHEQEKAEAKRNAAEAMNSRVGR